MLDIERNVESKAPSSGPRIVPAFRNGRIVVSIMSREFHRMLVKRFGGMDIVFWRRPFFVGTMLTLLMALQDHASIAAGIPRFDVAIRGR